MSYYDSYTEFQRDLDDRDDTYDPEFRQESDYCRDHGTYIGPPGGGDILCGPCEDGISRAEYLAAIRQERLRGVRERAERAAKLLSLLLVHKMGGMDAAHFAQDSSRIGNPRNRYGRH